MVVIRETGLHAGRGGGTRRLHHNHTGPRLGLDITPVGVTGNGRAFHKTAALSVVMMGAK